MSIADRRPDFVNPVYSSPFADPFCWHYEGIYYAVGTGTTEVDKTSADNMVVPLVKSRDLKNWDYVGNCLLCPEDEKGGEFWAPEVAYCNGKFFLYYHPNGSGGTYDFHIRVAISESPEGPFIDTGKPMTDKKRNSFAIDSHAFCDDDGQWYMFYATDFLDDSELSRRGTAIVMDKMLSMTGLAGSPQVVMRPRWPWQCFSRNRDWKGAVADWYTLEGPTVVKRSGKYYCFYSGGCWENESYGVDYLVADRIDGPWREVLSSDRPKLMRTIPGKVIGPGHHSIVSSPDSRQDYVVYHAWNETRTHRLMCVDPLIWTDGGPLVERFHEPVH